AWFLGFQALAALLSGPLFFAVGAAFTVMTGPETLRWPTLLLAPLPRFVLATVLQDPNARVPPGLSLFPSARPRRLGARRPVPPAGADGGPPGRAPRHPGVAAGARRGRGAGDDAGLRLGGRPGLPGRHPAPGEGGGLRRDGPVGAARLSRGPGVAHGGVSSRA